MNLNCLCECCSKKWIDTITWEHFIINKSIFGQFGTPILPSTMYININVGHKKIEFNGSTKFKIFIYKNSIASVDSIFEIILSPTSWAWDNGKNETEMLFEQYFHLDFRTFSCIYNVNTVIWVYAYYALKLLDRLWFLSFQ